MTIHIHTVVHPIPEALPPCAWYPDIIWECQQHPRDTQNARAGTGAWAFQHQGHGSCFSLSSTDSLCILGKLFKSLAILAIFILKKKAVMAEYIRGPWSTPKGVLYSTWHSQLQGTPFTKACQAPEPLTRPRVIHSLAWSPSPQTWVPQRQGLGCVQFNPGSIQQPRSIWVNVMKNLPSARSHQGSTVIPQAPLCGFLFRCIQLRETYKVAKSKTQRQVGEAGPETPFRLSRQSQGCLPPLPLPLCPHLWNWYHLSPDSSVIRDRESVSRSLPKGQQNQNMALLFPKDFSPFLK